MDEHSMRTIEQILQVMEEAANNDDYEEAHGSADDMLYELVELLAVRQNVDTRAKIRAILDAYGRVGKRYG